jgi:flagellar FliL protein
MAQIDEQKIADAEPAPATGPPQGSGKAARLAGGLVTYGLQFLLMLAAVVVGGMISARIGGGMHPAAAGEAAADADAAEPAPAPAKPAARPAAAAKPKKAASGPARYFALEPPLVVNLSENDSVRYLQVNVEVMARDEKVIQAVQQNVPLIRNDLVQLLSDRPSGELMSREGREKVRGEAQAAVNGILEREAAGAQIESLLFTGFVVQ